MRSRSVLIFRGGDNQPQVGGHGLLQSQQVDGELVDFDLDRVDAGFGAEDFFGGIAVLLRDRADAALNGGFHQRAHLEQLGFELFQFFDEVAHWSQLPKILIRNVR